MGTPKADAIEPLVAKRATWWDATLVDHYRAHRVELVRLAYLLVGRQSIAEDLVQDAVMAAQRSWRGVRDPGPYLRVAVVNRCRSWARRDQLERERRPAPPAPAHQEPDELWDALQHLKERQRAAIVLRFYVDLPDADIAELLGCRVATVRTTIHRGLKALRKEIER